MKEFFEKLRTERNRPESDIQKVEEVFSKQGILFGDLMAEGELAYTDEKLKEDGIEHRGLRTSILTLVKKYRTI